MKTKINGHKTEYITDRGDGLFDLYRGRIAGVGRPPCTTLSDIESYAKQLLEAVEAAKVVINMSEKG